MNYPFLNSAQTKSPANASTIFTQHAICQTYLTSDIIQEIFGDGTHPPATQAGQVPALSPYNNTLQDTDYSDTTDNYNPAPADFDRFDWTLTKRVAASADNNFLLSPLGLKLALAILTEAATGSTQAELASVLGFDLDKALVRKKFASILDSLQTKSSKYILNMGSRIYIGENGEPRQRFAAIAENYYKTELVKIDFTKPVEAASSINSWVANTTQGRLPNLVNSDDVANVALLVLTTLYFKGTWVHQFTPNETTTHNFYVTAKDTKPLEFMNVRNKFYFTESAKFDAKILRMPYLGKKFAMYIVVPNTLTGLPRVYNSLSELRAELYRLQRHLVDVSLPKFKFDYTSILDGILKELGIRQAFEDTASFPGIAHGQLERIKVSKVLQCSGIEVNELGSTAYSATEITLENKFGEEESFYELVANRPFMFFIQDEETRQLLFTGRVSDPSNADSALKF
ncbi:putative serpin-like protein [Papilio xuthus]|uniref:Putative serpin-like protein n=1 Tax=Papilio xuthus TaxID=66420 RepID=A0A194PSZ8_PAPXU|nr:putative serpin-like protein [Papilio xuthus]